jgi:hypothetical protein
LRPAARRHSAPTSTACSIRSRHGTRQGIGRRIVLPYDATFQTAIGGYPIGAIVESLFENLLFYASTVDNNVTNPDTGGAGWFVWSRN